MNLQERPCLADLFPLEFDQFPVSSSATIKAMLCQYSFQHILGQPVIEANYGDKTCERRFWSEFPPWVLSLEAGPPVSGKLWIISWEGQINELMKADKPLTQIAP